MTTKHQEWRAVRKIGTRGGTLQIINDLGGLICECDYPDKGQLIASAPTLLAALMDVLEAFSLGPLGAAAKYGPDVDLHAIEEAAVANARAAIREATGAAP